MQTVKTDQIRQPRCAGWSEYRLCCDLGHASCVLICYTLCKAIHVQQNDTCPIVISRICVRIKQVLIGWKLIFGYEVQWQQIHRKVEWFLTNQTLGDSLYPRFWLVKNHSTLSPKINFQPIRTCLTHMQFRGMTLGHVQFRCTCIALHSVY